MCVSQGRLLYLLCPEIGPGTFPGADDSWCELAERVAPILLETEVGTPTSPHFRAMWSDHLMQAGVQGLLQCTA